MKICIDLSEKENIRYLKSNISDIIFDKKDLIEKAYKNHYCISSFYLRENERLKYNQIELKSEIDYMQNINIENDSELNDFYLYLEESFFNLLSLFEDYKKFFLSIEIKQISEK